MLKVSKKVRVLLITLFIVISVLVCVISRENASKGSVKTVYVKISWNEILSRGRSLKFESPYAKWKNGPPKDPNFFPLCVWLQNPKNAAKYKELGINVYVGLWKGPTEEQLEELRKVGMYVICAQNDVALRYINDSIIIGWLQPDEPDNAQRLPDGSYGPPIPPDKVIEDYMKMRTTVPTRPILLNLGQGVAWDEWYGRGVRTNHPEDYLEYIKGCDIVSFDIYPVVHKDPKIAGKLWYVARGVVRLREWSRGQKIIWNCIETTRIDNPNVKPTPRQVKAEVWMSIIHGSMGIIYFVHQFKPVFIEAGLLADKEMSQAIKNINKQILELAPILNSPTLYRKDAVSVENETLISPIALMVKMYNGTIYIFAVNVQEEPVKLKITMDGMPKGYVIEVYGEGRIITPKSSTFEDYFDGLEVHIYRIVRK